MEARAHLKTQGQVPLDVPAGEQRLHSPEDVSVECSTSART